MYLLLFLLKYIILPVNYHGCKLPIRLDIIFIIHSLQSVCDILDLFQDRLGRVVPSPGRATAAISTYNCWCCCVVLIVVVETSDTSATLASRQYQYSDESPNKRYPDLETEHTRAWNKGYPKISKSRLVKTFVWLKAPTSAFTFKILLRHYAKQALTPR